MIPEPIRKFLDERHVPFRLEHHPLRVTAQEVAASAHISGKRFAKVVVLRCPQYVLAVLPADEKVDLERLGRLLAHPVELASEAEFAGRFPGCEPGAMPPFGDLYGMPVIVDGHLAQKDWIAFSAGTHTDVIEMQWTDFEQLTHPHVLESCESAAATPAH
jgi:Ala-tRNA(Pro) deacylase